MKLYNIDGVLRPAHNSTGKLIHPDENGIVNFWRWFGDSECVDGAGRPLVLYHGTIAWDRAEGIQQGDIDVFDRRYSIEMIGRPASIDAVGSWFSDTPGAQGASLYSGARSPGDGFPGLIYPVYLRFRSPWRVSYDGLREAWEDWHESSQVGNEARELYLRNKAWGGPDSFVRGFGYDDCDGVILDRGASPMSGKEFEHQQVFIAIHPESIKSALGNSGRFDPRSPSIADKNAMAPRPLRSTGMRL